MILSLKTKCPDCGRGIRVDGMDHAANAVRRTCRGCRQLWSIVIKPMAVKRPGMIFHEATFARVGG